jgi:hypothetical protein
MTDLAADVPVAGLPAPVTTSGPAAAAASAATRCRLVRVIKEIERRARADEATDDDARRYRLAWAALSFHGSPARVPHLPAIADEILSTKEALTVEFMVSPEAAGPAVAQ